MRVLCLKWGTKYGPEYVTNLQRMVKRHLPIPHDFICITEKPVDGVDCIPLLCEYPTWWSKIGLFKEPDGDTLYLDLDVVITDTLLPIVALLYKSPGLWARDDFSYSMRNPRQGLDKEFLKLLGGPGCINSSVMLWRGDVAKDVWDKFDPAVMNVMHGDQNFISNIMRDRIQYIPDEYVHSYKYHVLRGGAPGNVCVFHGDPKVTQLSKGDPLYRAWTQ